MLSTVFIFFWLYFIAEEAKYSSDGFTECAVHTGAARASEETKTKEGRPLGASIGSKRTSR